MFSMQSVEQTLSDSTLSTAIISLHCLPLVSVKPNLTMSYSFTSRTYLSRPSVKIIMPRIIAALSGTKYLSKYLLGDKCSLDST